MTYSEGNANHARVRCKQLGAPNKLCHKMESEYSVPLLLLGCLSSWLDGWRKALP
jgi:hypothetical protein